MKKYIILRNIFNPDNIFDNLKKRCKNHHNLN